MKKTVFPLLPALVLMNLACDLAPKYTRPALPVPEAWASGPAPLDETPAKPVAWQDYFTHPGLQRVIKMALENNLDLRLSSLNVEKMQAAYNIQRSDLFPNAGVMGSGSRYLLPEKMTNGPSKISSQYSVQVGIMGWELDFFGRLQSLKEKALNQYLATEQAQSSAILSLVSATALSYLTYAADCENLKLSQATYESQKTFFEMIRQSHEAGVASELDLRQAQSQRETARSDVAKFKGLVAMDQNALDFFVGKRVPANLLPKELSELADLKDIPAGLSSELLLRRPDILAAEFQLKSANANIGAARAAFFPRISLTAGLGVMSPSLTQLFDSGTGTWSFQPQILAPIFTGGSLKAGLAIATLNKEIALAQYEKAIQSSFRDVSDGLIRRSTLMEQLDAQQSLVQALEVTCRLSEIRYKEGLDSYLNVLVSQRSLYGAQQALVGTRLARQFNQIALFKALGGPM